MYHHYRTKAIFLKKEDRGEADRLFTLFTEDFGRLEILAKAIRKITSKLRAGADMFYLSEIEFIQGKAHKTLTDAVLIDNFKFIRQDMARLKTVYQLAFIFDTLIKEEEKDENLWQLLNEILEKLNSPGLLKNPQLLYHYFFWHLLSLLGYRPELENCVLCQKKLQPAKLYFSFSEGGLCGSSCCRNAAGESTALVSLETAKVLRLILKSDWQTLLKLKISPALNQALTELSEAYTEFLRY